MFTIDAGIKDFSRLTQNLYRVLFSMNNHQVATPEMSPEEARSYVLFLHEGKKRYSVYIGLHFLHTDRRMFYAHSSNPFLEEELQDVEEDARLFAEDLGAMLDEINFAKMSDLDRDRWIEEQPLFNEKKETVSSPAPSPAPPVEQSAPVAQFQAAVVTPPVEPPVPVAQPQAVPAAPPPVEQPAPVVQPRPVVVPPPAAPPPPVQRAPQAAPAAPIAAEPKPPATVVVSQYVQPEFVPAAPPVAPEKPKEAEQKTVKPAVARAQRNQQKHEPLTPTSVVTRDREALARLLTSF